MPFLVTFVACLVLGMEVGILIGVVIDVLLLLYYSARPKLLMESLTVIQVEPLRTRNDPLFVVDGRWFGVRKNNSNLADSIPFRGIHQGEGDAV